MLKMTKVASFLFLFAVMGNFAGFAQTPQLPQQQQQVKVEVSDSELSKFANAFQGIRMMNQQAQQQMMKVIQDEGMEVKRFNEIHQASQNPQVEVELTAEEKTQHENITSELEQMQSGFQQKMEKIITDQDLTIERYQEIAMGIQGDPELQERLQAVFQG